MAGAGAIIASTVVSTLVSTAVSILLAPDTEGPRLENRSISENNYGADVPIVYGSMMVPGVLHWLANNELKEKRHKESGKGGPTITTYTYSFYGAFTICEGNICAVPRIWADNVLVYAMHGAGNLTPDEVHKIQQGAEKWGVSGELV